MTAKELDGWTLFFRALWLIWIDNQLDPPIGYYFKKALQKYMRKKF